MMKFLRFLMYGGIVLFVLISKSQAIWNCLDVVKSDFYFFEDTRYFIVHSVFALVVFGYLCWLLGATLTQWRMPVWSHVIPLALLVWLLWENGWIFRTAGAIGARAQPRTFASPVTRAMGAMEGLQAFLTKNSCASATSEALLDALGDKKWTGYRSFGRPQPYRLIRSPGTEPVMKMPLEPQYPGTIFLVCNESDGSFALSALVTAAIPKGPVSFVVDGVGKPVTMIGRLRR